MRERKCIIKQFAEVIFARNVRKFSNISFIYIYATDNSYVKIEMEEISSQSVEILGIEAVNKVNLEEIRRRQVQDFMRYVNAETRDQEMLRDQCRKNINEMPEGTLVKGHYKGRAYYKVMKDGVRKSISANDPVIQRLKERRLCEEIERRATNNINLMQLVSRKYQNSNPVWCRDHLPKTYEGIPDDFL